MVAEGFKLSPVLLLLAVLAGSMLVGLASRTHKAEYYLVSGRSVGPLGIGAAIASNWMSAASFLGIAGIFYLQGYFALAYVIGWTGGYVLLLILMAGQIRRFGKYTAPEFVEARYDSPVARVLSAVIAILISLVYCVAQYKGIGLVFSWMFGFDYTRSLLLGTAVAISYLVVSGTLGAARNQQLHYAILIVCFIVPLMAVAGKLGYFWAIPQLGYGEALHDLAGDTGGSYTFPWTYATPYQWTALCFTLMVGTAGLPHVLSRFYTVPNVRDARWSVVWGIFFIGLLYWSAPAYAVFARIWEGGGPVADPQAARAVADIIVRRPSKPGADLAHRHCRRRGHHCRLLHRHRSAHHWRRSLLLRYLLPPDQPQGQRKAAHADGQGGDPRAGPAGRGRGGEAAGDDRRNHRRCLRPGRQHALPGISPRPVVGPDQQVRRHCRHADGARRHRRLPAARRSVPPAAIAAAADLLGADRRPPGDPGNDRRLAGYPAATGGNPPLSGREGAQLVSFRRNRTTVAGSGKNEKPFVLLPATSGPDATSEFFCFSLRSEPGR
jgi:hypothetical protein